MTKTGIVMYYTRALQEAIVDNAQKVKFDAV